MPLEISVKLSASANISKKPAIFNIDEGAYNLIIDAEKRSIELLYRAALMSHAENFIKGSFLPFTLEVGDDQYLSSIFPERSGRFFSDAELLTITLDDVITKSFNEVATFLSTSKTGQEEQLVKSKIEKHLTEMRDKHLESKKDRFAASFNAKVNEIWAAYYNPATAGQDKLSAGKTGIESKDDLKNALFKGLVTKIRDALNDKTFGGNIVDNDKGLDSKINEFLFAAIKQYYTVNHSPKPESFKLKNEETARESYTTIVEDLYGRILSYHKYAEQFAQQDQSYLDSIKTFIAEFQQKTEGQVIGDVTFAFDNAAQTLTVEKSGQESQVSYQNIGFFARYIDINPVLKAIGLSANQDHDAAKKLNDDAKKAAAVSTNLELTEDQKKEAARLADAIQDQMDQYFLDQSAKQRKAKAAEEAKERKAKAAEEAKKEAEAKEEAGRSNEVFYNALSLVRETSKKDTLYNASEEEIYTGGGSAVAAAKTKKPGVSTIAEISRPQNVTAATTAQSKPTDSSAAPQLTKDQIIKSIKGSLSNRSYYTNESKTDFTNDIAALQKYRDDDISSLITLVLSFETDSAKIENLKTLNNSIIGNENQLIDYTGYFNISADHLPKDDQIEVQLIAQKAQELISKQQTRQYIRSNEAEKGPDHSVVQPEPKTSEKFDNLAEHDDAASVASSASETMVFDAGKYPSTVNPQKSVVKTAKTDATAWPVVSKPSGVEDQLRKRLQNQDAAGHFRSDGGNLANGKATATDGGAQQKQERENIREKIATDRRNGLVTTLKHTQYPDSAVSTSGNANIPGQSTNQLQQAKATSNKLENSSLASGTSLAPSASSSTLGSRATDTSSESGREHDVFDRKDGDSTVDGSISLNSASTGSTTSSESGREHYVFDRKDGDSTVDGSISAASFDSASSGSTHDSIESLESMENDGQTVVSELTTENLANHNLATTPGKHEEDYNISDITGSVDYSKNGKNEERRDASPLEGTLFSQHSIDSNRSVVSTSTTAESRLRSSSDALSQPIKPQLTEEDIKKIQAAIARGKENADLSNEGKKVDVINQEVADDATSVTSKATTASSSSSDGLTSLEGASNISGSTGRGENLLDEKENRELDRPLNRTKVPPLPLDALEETADSRSANAGRSDDKTSRADDRASSGGDISLNTARMPYMESFGTGDGRGSEVSENTGKKTKGKTGEKPRTSYKELLTEATNSKRQPKNVKLDGKPAAAALGKVPAILTRSDSAIPIAETVAIDLDGSLSGKEPAELSLKDGLGKSKATGAEAGYDASKKGDTKDSSKVDEDTKTQLKDAVARLEILYGGKGGPDDQEVEDAKEIVNQALAEYFEKNPDEVTKTSEEVLKILGLKDFFIDSDGKKFVEFVSVAQAKAKKTAKGMESTDKQNALYVPTGSDDDIWFKFLQDYFKQNYVKLAPNEETKKILSGINDLLQKIREEVDIKMLERIGVTKPEPYIPGKLTDLGIYRSDYNKGQKNHDKKISFCEEVRNDENKSSDNIGEFNSHLARYQHILGDKLKAVTTPGLRGGDKAGRGVVDASFLANFEKLKADAAENERKFGLERDALESEVKKAKEEVSRIEAKKAEIDALHKKLQGTSDEKNKELASNLKILQTQLEDQKLQAAKDLQKAQDDLQKQKDEAEKALKAQQEQHSKELADKLAAAVEKQKQESETEKESQQNQLQALQQQLVSLHAKQQANDQAKNAAETQAAALQSQIASLTKDHQAAIHTLKNKGVSETDAATTTLKAQQAAALKKVQDELDKKNAEIDVIKARQALFESKNKELESTAKAELAKLPEATAAAPAEKKVAFNVPASAGVTNWSNKVNSPNNEAYEARLKQANEYKAQLESNNFASAMPNYTAQQAVNTAYAAAAPDTKPADKNNVVNQAAALPATKSESTVVNTVAASAAKSDEQRKTEPVTKSNTTRNVAAGGGAILGAASLISFFALPVPIIAVAIMGVVALGSLLTAAFYSGNKDSLTATEQNQEGVTAAKSQAKEKTTEKSFAAAIERTGENGHAGAVAEQKAKLDDQSSSLV